MTDVLGADMAAFRASLSGRLVTADDTDYDSIRSECVWNGYIQRRPWMIVQCATPQDVAATISFARAAGRDLSVRGGGHGFSGSCVVDDGVMIDLGPMSEVTIDPAARRARCGGGTRWAQLDAAAQEHALAAPGGFISHTGIAGLTLGGGIGWLTKKAGLSCDNLAAVEIVTADGRLLRASEEENSDLFWAVRGGGGNFGVVTAFEFRLHPVGPMVHLALLFWDLDGGSEALRAARDLEPSLPQEVSMFIGGLNAPPAPFVPEQHQLQPGYAVVVVGFGSPEEHAAATDRLRQAAPPLFEFVTPIPYTALQQMFDESAPWGINGYEKAVYLDELSNEAIDVIVRHIPRKASPMSFMPVFVLGGEYSRKDEMETAFGGSRRSRYVVNIAAVAPTRELLEADREWARTFWSDLVPHAQGVGSYVNFMAEFEQDRIVAAYGKEKYDKLAALKEIYDPENVFHHNANIRPGRS